jgi:hypothetical protein
MLLQDFLLAWGRRQCAACTDMLPDLLGRLVKVQFLLWIQVITLQASALLLGRSIGKQIIKVVLGTVHYKLLYKLRV